MGLAAIIMGLLFLSMLFISIIGNGYTAFWQTFIQLEVHLDASEIDPDGTRDPDVIAAASYGVLVKKSLRDMFPDVTGRRDKRKLYGIVSSGASFYLRDFVVANPDKIGTTIQLWVPADDDVDMLIKGHFDRDKVQAERRHEASPVSLDVALRHQPRPKEEIQHAHDGRDRSVVGTL